MPRRLSLSIAIISALLLAIAYCSTLTIQSPIPTSLNTDDGTDGTVITDTNASREASADANAIDTADVSTNVADTPEVLPGKGNFTEPEPMEVGAWYPLQFHIGRNAQALADQAQGAPTTAAQPIHISRLMKVTLQPDPDFEIRAKSKDEQDTGADWAATWVWDVKPLTEGKHTLFAHVEVAMLDGKGNTVNYDEYDSRVGVEVKVGSWQGLLNGLAHAKSLGDALTTLFQSWRGTLLALAGLIGAGFAVRWAIASKQPAKDENPTQGADATD